MNISIVENATDCMKYKIIYIIVMFLFNLQDMKGSSLTTLEAMVHGCLIIATPVGGIPDKIINYRTGSK